MAQSCSVVLILISSIEPWKQQLHSVQWNKVFRRPCFLSKLWAAPVANKKQEPAEKELPPPTGKKGCALFDFEGQLQKEADLSFNKGANIDLTYTVNENWLEGRLSQAKGIFPTAYVQVLSHEQLRELYSLKRRLLYCMMSLPTTSNLSCSYPSRRVLS